MDILKDFGVQFLNLFLQIVIVPLLGVVAGFVIAWLKKKIEVAKASLDASTQKIIDDTVKAMVLAAEQVHLVDKLIVKKDYALEQAANYLAAKGIPVDLDKLSDLIEAEVMAQFNQDAIVERKVIDHNGIVVSSNAESEPE